MIKKTLHLLAVLALAALPAFAAEDGAVNALLLLKNDRTAFDRRFQDFLNKGGARLTDAHPPYVFTGHIPERLDAELGQKYGAKVYRGKIEDLSAFALYGEKAVMAANIWNKRLLADPASAPLVISTKARKAGRDGEGIELSWNEVMKASSYRLQISPDPEFGRVPFEVPVQGNSYVLYPAFWPDGVHYWRVAGRMKLNTAEERDSPFSKPDSFAVSKPPRKPDAEAPRPPALPAEARFTGRDIRWDAGHPFYRVQLAYSGDFSAPVADVFTDTNSYRAALLPLEAGSEYFMRVMASDGYSASAWSAPSSFIYAPAKKRRPRRGGRR
jgi:hypothetical protein